MNYFAHARVAAERSEEPAFVLGAMLPDFAHMIGARIAHIDHPALREGQRHHHETDDAFHRAPRFVTLVRDATNALQAAGVARGPARGAAHVGIELLLDGALLGDPRADASYLDALEEAPALEHAIQWSRAEANVRWQRLHFRLRESGLPEALREPARVTERVVRVLQPRARLRIAPHEREIVGRWLDSAKPEVDRFAPELLEQAFGGIA